MSDDYQKQQNLSAARNRDKRNKSTAKNTTGDIKDIIKAKTPWGAVKTLKKINPLSDWPFILALLAAIIKDIIDPFGLAVITYILIIILTICVSIFIAMMMILAGKTRMLGWIILLCATITEIIIGVNILIIETAAVITIFSLKQPEK